MKLESGMNVCDKHPWAPPTEVKESVREGGVIFCNGVIQPCEEPELRGCRLQLSHPHWHRVIIIGDTPVIEWDVEAPFTENTCQPTVEKFESNAKL